jgi:hypothetical protein
VPGRLFTRRRARTTANAGLDSTGRQTAAPPTTAPNNSRSGRELPSSDRHKADRKTPNLAVVAHRMHCPPQQSLGQHITRARDKDRDTLHTGHCKTNGTNRTPSALVIIPWRSRGGSMEQLVNTGSEQLRRLMERASCTHGAEAGRDKTPSTAPDADRRRAARHSSALFAFTPPKLGQRREREPRVDARQEVK